MKHLKTIILLTGTLLFCGCSDDSSACRTVPNAIEAKVVSWCTPVLTVEITRTNLTEDLQEYDLDLSSAEIHIDEAAFEVKDYPVWFTADDISWKDKDITVRELGGFCN